MDETMYLAWDLGTREDGSRIVATFRRRHTDEGFWDEAYNLLADSWELDTGGIVMGWWAAGSEPLDVITESEAAEIQARNREWVAKHPDGSTISE